MTSRQPILCYVTDGASLGGDEAALLRMMQNAMRAGVDWIQIREKTISAQALLRLVRAAVAQPERKTRILVNDRLDVAIAAGADGVHLGNSSLPVADVRDWLGKEAARLHVAQDFLVGRSCHSLEEAQRAESEGASHLIFGPVFATPSKMQYGAPQGAERLGEVCRAVRVPVLAIGGVTVENAAQCLRAGAAGIAAIRLFQESSAVKEVVMELRSFG